MKTQTKKQIKDMKIDYFMYGMLTSLCFGIIMTILISSFFYNQTYLYREGFEAGKLNVSCEIEPPYKSNLDLAKLGNSNIYSLGLGNISFAPEISQKPRNNIVSINLEVCKPISCPQPYVGIYTLQACYNCSEVLEQ